jgi:hypothetical protein
MNYEAAGNLITQPFEHGSSRLDNEVAPDVVPELGKWRERQEFVHSRNLAEQFRSPIPSCICRGTHGLHFSIGPPPGQ